MKNLGKLTLAIAVIALMAITTNASKVYAERECFTQYGGGEICIDKDAKLRVDKKIYNPDSEDYENNINRKDGSHPYTFEDEETIKFKIVVENVGDVTIEDINLEDIMPSILEYESGDGDEDGDKVKFDKFDLEPGEKEEFTFKAKVEFNGIAPDDDYICVSNVAKAKGEREDNGEKEDDTDYANFCVDLEGRKGRVLGKETIKRLPTTGPIDTQLIFIGMSGAGLAMIGYGLRKLSKKED